jgi:ABC-type branched-subunit amino acid transport system substrate-binding protein
VALAACGPQPQPRATAAYDPPRTRVALLLPLSGSNAAIGRSLQQATEMALFDAGSPAVEFIPRDTGGSPGGAADAMRGAISAGARYAVGPLTAAETSAASGAARAARVPMLAFTNDAGQASPGIWTLGITPAQQVRRVVGAAAGRGARRFALAAPEDSFGRALATAMRGATDDLGLAPPVVVLYPARADLTQVSREIAQRGGSEAIDALLIGESGSRARELGGALGAAGLQAPPLRVLGTVLWADDAALVGAPGLTEAVFAGPDARQRASFESRYQAAFGQRPPRIAAVAYDAAMIAARAAASGSPLGGGSLHQGVDGPVRLLPDGQVLRGLALYVLGDAGEPRQIESAPSPVPGT